MPHLRRGIYKSLVTLEAALDRHEPRPPVEVIDLDHDGVDEMVLHNEKLQAIVKLDGRAAICELDSYELGQNFGDTLRRHAEHYHRRALEQHKETKAKGDGIASAHDRFHAKHEIAPADVAPDGRGRGMFHDRWNGAEVTTYSGDPMDTRAAFVAQAEGAALRKRIAIQGGRLIVEYQIEAEAPGTFTTELDIAMPCCDGYAGRFVSGGAILGGFGQPAALDAATDLVLDDRYMNGSVAISASRAIAMAAGPYRTVSQSEDGLEKVMQSVTVRLSTSVTAGMHEITLALEVRPGLDDDLLSANGTSSRSRETRIA
jgi:4-alpha-glucanotransferase/alpha-amylase